MRRKTISEEEYQFERDRRARENAEFLIRQGFTTKELLEIYDNLNGGTWDERIGEKPEGFDNMESYKPDSFLNILMNRRYKEDTQLRVIMSWLRAIDGIVPELEMEKHFQKKGSPFTEEPEEISEEEAEIRARASIAIKKTKSNLRY